MKQNYKKWTLGLLVALGVASCVNGDYNLDDISLETTLGPNGIVVPLGDLSEQSLDDLLSGVSVEQLKADAEGNYSLYFADEINENIDKITIDPITGLIPQIDPVYFDFGDAALPDDMSIARYENHTQVALPQVNIGSSVAMPDLDIPYSISIPQEIAGVPVVPGDVPLTLGADSSQKMDISCPLNDEVESINKIEFGSASAAGSVVMLNFDAGKLAPVIGSGNVTARVAFPSGYELALTNSYGSTAHVERDAGSATNNVFVVENYTPSSADEFGLSFKIMSVTIASSNNSGSEMKLGGDVSYSFDYNILTTAGAIATTGELPKVTLLASPTFKDALFTLRQTRLAAINDTYAMQNKFENLGDQISRVNYIALNSGSTLKFSMTDLNLPFAGGDFSVKIQFPKTFDFGLHSGLDNSTNIFEANISSLGRGVSIPVKGLRFDGDKGVIKNGELNISEQVVVTASPELQRAEYRLSAVSGAMGTKDIEFTLEEMPLQVDMGNSQIEANAISQHVTIAQPIKQQVDVPEQVARIDKLYIRPHAATDWNRSANVQQPVWANVGASGVCRAESSSEPSTVSARISLKISDSPVRYVNLRNIKISMPSCVMVASPVADGNNVISIPDMRIDTQKDLDNEVVVMQISGFENLGIQNGKVLIDDQMSIQCDVCSDSGASIQGDKTNVKITPKVDMGTIIIDSFVGELNIDFSSYIAPVEIDLADLKKSLGDGEVSFDVLPSLSLDFTNPIGAQIDTDIKISTYDEQGEVLENINIKNLTIEAATVATGLTPRVTKLLVTSDENLQKPSYKKVYCPDLVKLLTKLPNKISVELLPKLNADQPHFAQLGTDYSIVAHYEVEVPLELGQNTLINYTSAFDDLNSDFKSVADMGIKSESMVIVALVESSLPLDLNMSARLLDVNGSEVKGVQAKVEGFVGGFYPESDSGVSKISKVAIRLLFADSSLDNLGTLDAIELTLKGSVGGTQVAALNQNQFVKAKLQLLAEKGVTLDLGKILK